MTFPQSVGITEDLTIHLVGESHLGQYDRLSDGLERLLLTAGIAVWYTERPVERPTVGDYTAAAIRLPLYLIGMCVTQMLYGPLYALRAGTQQAVETEAVLEVASAHGVPTVPVDTHPSQLVPALSVGWFGLGWLGMVVSLAVAPVLIGVVTGWVVVYTSILRILRRRRVAYETPLALLFGWGGLVAIVPLGVVPLAFSLGAFIVHGLVIRRTASSREAAMAQRVLSHISGTDHEAVCLTVGAAHLDGLAEQFDSYGVSTVRHTNLGDRGTASG